MVGMDDSSHIAPVEFMVTPEGGEGYTEDDFIPEALPHLQRWAADLVADNIARYYYRTGIDEPECIVDAHASYVTLFGKRLALIRLAVPPDEHSDPVAHMLMAVGFTERGLERLSLYRGSDHPIELNDPACARALYLLFGQNSSLMS